MLYFMYGVGVLLPLWFFLGARGPARSLSPRFLYPALSFWAFSVLCCWFLVCCARGARLWHPSLVSFFGPL